LAVFCFFVLGSSVSDMIFLGGRVTMMKMESFVRAGSSIESLLREELSDLLGDEWNGVGRSGVKVAPSVCPVPKGKYSDT
jgi:hypothetical protein